MAAGSLAYCFSAPFAPPDQHLRHFRGPLVIAGQALRHANRRVGLLGINQPPHPLAIVVGGELRLELGGHRFLKVGLKVRIIPHLLHQLPRRGLVAPGQHGAGQRQGPFRRYRLALGEVLQNEIGGFAVAVERLLGALGEGVGQRPVRRLGEKIHDAVIASLLRVIAQVEELDQLDRRHVARPLGQNTRFQEISSERQLGGFDRQTGNLRRGQGRRLIHKSRPGQRHATKKQGKGKPSHQAKAHRKSLSTNSLECKCAEPEALIGFERACRSSAERLMCRA